MIIFRRLAILFILLLGILMFLLSPIGLNTTLYLVSSFIPGKLTYDSVRGNLAKSLTLTNLEYKNKFIDIKSDYLRIVWYPRKLIHRELAIENVTAHNISIEIYGKEDKSQKTTEHATPSSIKFSPLDFSWVVTIKHSIISNIKLKYSVIDKVFNIPLVTLQGTLDRNKTDLKLYVNSNIENQPGGTILIKGGIKDYTITADYKHILKKQYYTLTAKGNQTHITAKINTESYQADTLNIKAEAYLDWDKKLTWQGHLQGEGLPLFSFPRLYPLDRGKFDLIFEGFLDGSSLKQHVVMTNATLWLINGTRLNGQALLTQENSLLTFNATFKNNDDYLILNASVNHDINLSWKLHVSELSNLWMSLNGSLTSNGMIQKQSNRSAITAYLNLSNSSIANVSINDINVNVNGSFDRHTVTIDSNIQQAKISSQFVGKLGVKPLTWSCMLNKLTVSSTNLGLWKLVKSTALSFSKQIITVNPLHVTSSDKKGDFFIALNWSRVKRTMDGKLSFNMTSLPLPFLNITLNQIKANASANGHSANFAISAFSDGNPVELVGNAHWRKTLALKAKLSGNNILVVNTAEYVVRISPALMLSIQNQRIDLTGKLFIPVANIAPDDFISVVSLPPDVVFVGAARKEPSFFKFYTNGNLVLGDDISINIQGIKGKLKGALVIIKSPDQPFVGNGQLSTVNASYNILGQNLTITKGHLNFANSTLSNPNLDIQASRTLPTSLSTTVERLTVGANVSGTLRRPQISLFSRPVQLSDVDIISYLLFGSSAGGASSSGGSAANAFILLQLANSLKSGKHTGDTGLLQKLKGGFGITELGLQTQTDVDAIGNVVSSNEQFVAGAYLSPKLYFRYRYDLFYEENIFETQYLLNKHWIAQTNASSQGNGADILYRIERGE